ncbi:MAG: tetratricopeptide repeat protein [Alkalispirochaeta sp.]
MRRVLTAASLVVVLFASGCRSDISSRELAEEYFNLGNAFFELGRYQDSFDYYSRAIELSPEIPAAGYNLARLHEQRGEYPAALDVLDDLLDEDPENGLYRETRAFVLFRDGQRRQAREEYTALIGEYPARVRLRYNLGLLELDADNADRAYQTLIDGVELAEEDAEYQWVLSEAAYRSGREDEAAEHLEVFRGLSAEEPEELARLADRQAEWGFYLSALEVLEEIPDTVDGDGDLLFLRGSVELRATDDFDRAVDSIAAAVRAGYDPEQETFADLLDTLPEDERTIIENRVRDVVEDLEAVEDAQAGEEDEADEGGEEDEEDEDSSSAPSQTSDESDAE